jgi:hypothetical protein
VAEAADVTTAKFLEASQEYFNESVGDSELRVTYTQHLLSELTNQTPTISPRTFAETNLHTEHIQPYLNHVSNKGVVAGQFPKDTKFVDNKLSKLRLNFEHGLSIVATRDGVEDYLSVTTMVSGETRAVITDRLKDVKGA